MVQNSEQGGGGGGGATGPKRIPVPTPKDRPSPEDPRQTGVPIGMPVTAAEFEEMKRKAAEQDPEAAGAHHEDSGEEDATKAPEAGNDP